MSILSGDDVATLRGILDRVKASRPSGAAQHMHFAVEDALSGVIAAGVGSSNPSRDFRSAEEGARKAEMQGSHR